MSDFFLMFPGLAQSLAHSGYLELSVYENTLILYSEETTLRDGYYPVIPD